MKNKQNGNQQMMKEMKPEVLNEIQDMLSNKRRIELDRSHPNKQLFVGKDHISVVSIGAQNRFILDNH